MTKGEKQEDSEKKRTIQKLLEYLCIQRKWIPSANFTIVRLNVSTFTILERDINV